MSVGDKRVLQSLIKLMASNAEKVKQREQGSGGLDVDGFIAAYSS